MNSRLARSVLGFFYHPGRFYRVPLGPNRRKWLLYERSVNYHAVLGLWESKTFRLLDRLFREIPAQVIADVGANLGYYSLYFADQVGVNGVVDAFEPAPDTFQMLQRNVEKNASAAIRPHQLACSSSDDPVTFFVADHHHCSSLVEAWAGGTTHAAREITVQAVTLDTFYAARHPPDFIKMDIEGGGVYALRGVGETVRTRRPLLLIESHIPDEDSAIAELICTHDYQAFRLSNDRWVTERSKPHPAPEGVWGVMLLVPSEQRSKVESIIT